MKENKTILITGALGFIGSCLVKYLNDLGYENLFLVDDFDKTDKWKNLVGKKFIDIIPIDQTFSFLEKQKIQSIVHLGACSDTTCDDSSYLMENNVRYSQKLAEVAFSNNARFIYASSAATYGDGSLGFSDSLLDDLKPLNMYGYSKQLFDMWLKKNNHLNKVVGLKYFNVFGPNENHKGKMASVIFKMTNIAKEGGSVKLFKSNEPLKYLDGEQKRDFIYVKDVVKITTLFLEPPFLDVFGIFNVGRGEANTWNKVVKALFAALQKEAQIEYIDMPKELNSQYQNYTCADMTKFNSLCQTKKFHMKWFDIEDAIFDYVQNYLLKDVRW
ncbi:MAG: ADP-glyceromanno-heptose 6-epimerase [Chlamydiae bacterium]|nr:ADP-glyceromanno-heptose 6-epimerase [Chlamydiota bacterium]